MEKPASYLCGGLMIVALIAIVSAAVMLSTTNYGNTLNNSTIVKASISAYKVNFKNFNFTIPDNLVYEVNDHQLLIGDEVGTWTAQIEIQEGSYNIIKDNKNMLQMVLQKSGYKATSPDIKTLGGIEYLTLEIVGSGQKAVTGITKANSMYFMTVTVFNRDNDYDYSILTNLSSVVSSASYEEEKNSIVSYKGFTYDLTSIAK